MPRLPNSPRGGNLVADEQRFGQSGELEQSGDPWADMSQDEGAAVGEALVVRMQEGPQPGAIDEAEPRQIELDDPSTALELLVEDVGQAVGAHAVQLTAQP